MIYFVSDLHGEYYLKGFQDYINQATDDDLLIILGDIGLEFEKNPTNKNFTEKFLSTRKNIAIIDGNHENHEYLKSFPEVNWNGGMVHKLTDTIVHLMRGQVYNISGENIFVFGGCKSSAKWKEMGLWYDGEEANETELKTAYDNIEKYGRKLDYVLTHKYERAPIVGNTSIKLLELCTFIDENVQFKKWYSGHWHNNSKLDERHSVVYDKLIKLGE